MKSNLKAIMDSRGMKQSFLRRKVGISASTMSALYRGESVPTLKVALRIAKELALPVEEIWRLDE